MVYLALGVSSGVDIVEYPDSGKIASSIQAGPERKRFAEQAQLDYMDYAMIGDAEATLEDGILTLRVDLRPDPNASPEGAAN